MIMTNTYSHTHTYTYLKAKVGPWMLCEIMNDLLATLRIESPIEYTLRPETWPVATMNAICRIDCGMLSTIDSHMKPPWLRRCTNRIWHTAATYTYTHRHTAHL
jgi:hypothetical protein